MNESHTVSWAHVAIRVLARRDIDLLNCSLEENIIFKSSPSLFLENTGESVGHITFLLARLCDWKKHTLVIV